MEAVGIVKASKVGRRGTRAIWKIAELLET
jgi:hypothetical protein